MFIEDKIQRLILDNEIKDHNVSFLVQFDNFNDVKVIELKDVESNVAKKYEEKLEELENEIIHLKSEIEDLEEQIEELELEYL